MATGSRGFDKRGVKRCEAVGTSDDCSGTDVPTSDLSDDERETRDNDNAFALNVVNVSIFQSARNNFLNITSANNPIQFENPSNVKNGDENGDRPGPVLREHWKPRGLLSVGRSRLGFPDCDNDHSVQLLVCKNQHTREILDIAGHYDVSVAVSYDGESASGLKLPDYQCKRIKSKTKSDTDASMIGVIGYLFRLHEPDTRYKITFSLNAIPPKRSWKKTSLKENKACETICQISVTLETGPMISSKTGKAKKTANESTDSNLFALSPPSLSKESTVLYKRSWWVTKQLRPYRANAEWEDFDKHANNLLLRFTDADTHIAIKLEQGMKAHYQKRPDHALQLIDEAFNFMSEANNPELLAGKGYVYRAEILRAQGSLGNAEHCVNLGWQNITGCQTGLDTSLIAWERAIILMNFIGHTPHRSLNLVNEAQRSLENCIDVCLHLETESSQLFVKQLFVLALLAMTMLLLDCDSNVSRRRIVSEEFISKAQWCLDTLRNKNWSEMTMVDRVDFYLCNSYLEYRRNNYTRAEEFAHLAKNTAGDTGLYVLHGKAQEHLDFIRGIKGGHTIDNGPWQSESEGENADISSSEAESDWLAAILN